MLAVAHPLQGLPVLCGAGCTLVSGVSSWACQVPVGLCAACWDVWGRLGGWWLSGVPVGNLNLLLALDLYPKRKG